IFGTGGGMLKTQEDQSTQGLQGRSSGVWGPSAILICSLGLMASCGPKLAPYVEPKPAPTSQEEVGMLVTLDSAESVTRLLEHPKAKLRPLHPPTFMYEVNGLTEAEIREIAPNLKWIAPNKYHSNLKMEEPIRGLSTIFEKLGCKGSSPKPMATILAPAGLKDKIVKRPASGAKVTLSIKKVPGAPAGLGVVWLTNAPEGSKSNLPPQQTLQLNLTVDLLGEYQALLVAKTKEGICSADQISFGVTDNTPYQGKKPARVFGTAEREQFLHLRILQAEEAWTIGKGKGVRVAIVDTGINYNHPDLAQNIQTNPGEIAGNNIDDDRNGFVDDAYGYDFANGDGFPLDDGGHGTHVAGLTASAVTGVAPEASLLAVKVLNAFGGADSGSTLAAVKYAADQNSQIINLSLGGYIDDQELKTAWMDTMAYANSRGALVVAAAGNGDDTGKSVDIDKVANLPGGLPSPNLLTIASIGLDGKLAPYSNFGLKTVSVAAPGGAPVSPTNKSDGGLLSTSYEPSVTPYVKMMGTSMASPVAAGVVALVAGMAPGATPAQLKAHVLKTAFPVQALKGLMNVGGTLHALRAIQPLKGRNPNDPLATRPQPKPVVSNWRPRMTPESSKAPVTAPLPPKTPSFGLENPRR
ncbi:MAG: S8 family serine peptidase, partial [Bdellovibrionales bacterium]|nr:S8 family serine peptidase [Bdellovibrionales bacterium]